MKIVTVIGARPQFIKAAVLSRLIRSSPGLEEIIVHTGQHYDQNMSDVFFNELNIPIPDYNLAIGGGTHGSNTGRMLERIEALLTQIKPDRVLVYGDTDSTLAGALSAAKLNIPVAHVEAGLRSFNRAMPEEINRVLTDHVSDKLFSPSVVAKNNLLNEGITPSKIQVVGDIMLDAAQYYSLKAKKPVWMDNFNFSRYMLCTIHRAENTGDRSRLKGIFSGLGALAIPVVLPLHPRTKKMIESAGLIFPDNFFIVDPVGYLEMVWLEKNATCVATDSGGVQKEAFFHRKPCLTLREETEWTELVDLGVNKLVGTDPARIAEGYGVLAFDSATYDSEPYGSGTAGQDILTGLVS